MRRRQSHSDLEEIRLPWDKCEMCPGTQSFLKHLACPKSTLTCFSFLSDQFNEQLISPKEFVCLAGKSTLKDWKRAIRLNGTMLRSGLVINRQ